MELPLPAVISHDQGGSSLEELSLAVLPRAHGYSSTSITEVEVRLKLLGRPGTLNGTVTVALVLTCTNSRL
jgi:hypothetical protein